MGGKSKWEKGGDLGFFFRLANIVSKAGEY